MFCSSRGDEDEVFVGPVSHKEKCVSASVGSPLKDGMAWSPLTGEQLEAVCQEAHRVASQLQTTSPLGKDTDTSTVTAVAMTEAEAFFQDAETKLGLLTQSSGALSPIKRKTFCVQDSPFTQLPPVIQHHLQRSHGSDVTAAVRSTTASSARSTFKDRLSTSSPVARAQPRTALRGKAALGVAVVLPSKPTIPVTTSSTSKSRVEKTKLQAPRKVRFFIVLFTQYLVHNVHRLSAFVEAAFDWCPGLLQTGPYKPACTACEWRLYHIKGFSFRKHGCILCQTYLPAIIGSIDIYIVLHSCQVWKGKLKWRIASICILFNSHEGATAFHERPPGLMRLLA